MSELFLAIVNMSISAGWLVLAVIAARWVLRKAPRWVNVVLWGMVALRMVCPFTIESALSLIPSAQTISPEIMLDPTPSVDTGISSINAVVNPIIADSFTPEPFCSANPLQIWIPVAGQFWLLGMVVMALYTAVSYFRLHRRIRTAVHVTENIWLGGGISSPFVLGILRPRICLPEGLEDTAVAHVIAHEQTHIRRKDHWWKPLGFLLLTIHWFNPLMWIAYILLCRDIELACDEKVIQELGRDQRADYSQALLRCSVGRGSIAACPLAFGEVGVRQRVKNVLRYKKPGFRIMVIALLLCAAVAVCFLTNPNSARAFPMAGQNVAVLEPEAIQNRVQQIIHRPDVALHVIPGYPLMLTEDFDWAEDGVIQFWYYGAIRDTQRSAQLRIFREDGEFNVTHPGSWEQTGTVCFLKNYLEALKYMPQSHIRALSPDADRYMVRLVDWMLDGRGPGQCDRAITYTETGAGPIDGFRVHLELQPLYARDDGYHGMGDEVIHLFYGSSLGGQVEIQRPLIAQIIDRSVAEAIPTDQVLEPFWEDEGAVYSFSSIRSHLVMVTYIDGVTEDIKTALAAGRATMEDLKIFGIHYYVEPKTEQNVELRGIFGSYLYVPMDGEVCCYAFESAGYSAWGREVLDVFRHNGEDWSVYTMQNYPDRSKVLLISENGAAWVCVRTGQPAAADEELLKAISAGYAVVEDGTMTHGRDAWNAFRQTTQAGAPALLTLVHYYAATPEGVLNGGYSNYPMLREYTVSFDGDGYTVRTGDGVKEYAHLIAYDNGGTQGWFLANEADQAMEKILEGLHDGTLLDHSYFIICARNG